MENVGSNITQWLAEVLGSEPEAKEYGPTGKQYMYFVNKPFLYWKGKKIDESGALAVITFCGPGSICFFRFTLPHYGDIVLFHTHTPEDDMELRTRFIWYANKNMPKLLVWYVVGLWISQWSNDIDIWENKIHLLKPVLVNGDGPINKCRRWFKQFYYKGQNNDIDLKDHLDNIQKNIQLKEEESCKKNPDMVDITDW